MSRFVRKPAFCICENKGADQLRGNTHSNCSSNTLGSIFEISREVSIDGVGDRMGKGWVCWSLGNAHTALGKNKEVIMFASKHLKRDED